jgi:hypothetical protein
MSLGRLRCATALLERALLLKGERGDKAKEEAAGFEFKASALELCASVLAKTPPTPVLEGAAPLPQDCEESRGMD